jgi:hypothetical protein
MIRRIGTDGDEHLMVTTPLHLACQKLHEGSINIIVL